VAGSSATLILWKKKKFGKGTVFKLIL